MRAQGERGASGALARAVAAYEAALTVRTREADPARWALTQMNLGNALVLLGERSAIEQAVSAFDAALRVRTREADPAGWADTTYSLAMAWAALGRYATARAAAEAAAAVYEQVGNAYWAREARAFIAQLPAE